MNSRHPFHPILIHNKGKNLNYFVLGVPTLLPSTLISGSLRESPTRREQPKASYCWPNILLTILLQPRRESHKFIFRLLVRGVKIFKFVSM